MAWIESHQALGHHPKTLRLAAELRCSVPCAIGYLHLFWWWALDYAPDGVVCAGDKDVIAKACMWSKKSEQFWAALLTSGFVEGIDEEMLNIHDWMDYAGRLVQQRAANAQRMRDARAKHVQRTSGTRAGATGPDRTGPVKDAAAVAVAVNGPGASRARTRGSGGFQPLGAFLKPPAAAAAAQDQDLPDEVRERLSRPPIVDAHA